MLCPRSALALAACCIALAACSRSGGTPAQQPAASPAAPPSSHQTATLAPSPSPAARSIATAIVVQRRLPKRAPRLPADAAPQILGVAISETTVRPGDRLTGSVLTSSNVASVEARIGGYGLTLQKVGVGRFELAYTVGPLPWFVHGKYTMEVVARNTRGDTVRRSIPLTVR